MRVMAQVSDTERSALSPPARRWAPLSIAAALVLPLLASLVLVPFRDHFANAAAALVLVAVVVGIAVVGDRRAGWLAALSSAVWFDFFLTKPYERFAISASSDIETTVALLVVGVAVTEIAVRSRHHFVVAVAEGNYLALIHDVSELVARGAAPAEVAAAASDELVELLTLSSCRFEPGNGRAGRPQLLRNGEVELGDVRFDVEQDGFPDQEVDLPVASSHRSYGIFVMAAASHRGVTIEERVVALVLADQVAAAFAGAESSASA